MSAERNKSEIPAFASGRLVHKWGERFCLDIEGINIEPQTSYAVLGANGSGKSTLLRLLAGLMIISEQFSAPGAVGYLPQSPYAFRMTVADNVRLGISPELGLTQNEQDEAISTSLESLGLLHLRNEPGNKLSGGEAQRMALARLMVVKRSILLLDEPTGALDLQGLSLAETAITKYLADTGCSMILVTHQLSLAERLCEQLLYLDNGCLDAAGPMADTLRSQPTNSLIQFLRFEKACIMEPNAEGMIDQL